MTTASPSGLTDDAASTSRDSSCQHNRKLYLDFPLPLFLSSLLPFPFFCLLSASHRFFVFSFCSLFSNLLFLFFLRLSFLYLFLSFVLPPIVFVFFFCSRSSNVFLSFSFLPVPQIVIFSSFFFLSPILLDLSPYFRFLLLRLWLLFY